MAEEDEKQIHHDADAEHADAVAQIGIGDLLEDSYGPMESAHEGGRPDANGNAQRAVKQQDHKRARIIGKGGELGQIESGRNP